MGILILYHFETTWSSQYFILYQRFCMYSHARNVRRIIIEQNWTLNLLHYTHKTYHQNFTWKSNYFTHLNRFQDIFIFISMTIRTAVRANYLCSTWLTTVSILCIWIVHAQTYKTYSSVLVTAAIPQIFGMRPWSVATPWLHVKTSIFSKHFVEVKYFHPYWLREDNESLSSN